MIYILEFTASLFLILSLHLYRYLHNDYPSPPALSPTFAYFYPTIHILPSVSLLPYPGISPPTPTSTSTLAPHLHLYLYPTFSYLYLHYLSTTIFILPLLCLHLPLLNAISILPIPIFIYLLSAYFYINYTVSFSAPNFPHGFPA